MAQLFQGNHTLGIPQLSLSELRCGYRPLAILKTTLMVTSTMGVIR
jgi:hypothetical protein